VFDHKNSPAGRSSSCWHGRCEGFANTTENSAVTQQRHEETAGRGVLLARPDLAKPGGGFVQPGAQPLGLGGRRDGLVLVPAGYTPARPAPLAMMLHGAGGSAGNAWPLLQPLAGAAGFLVLAPDSRGRTWDVILHDYGGDVTFLDRALAQVFERYAVDPAHLAIAGFSDGASYALSLGLANGDLFTHVLAFSPGFAAPARRLGAPRIFVSHGVADTVLPIDACSRRIVPRLKQAGYPLDYNEFDGGHTVPPEIASQALEWFLGR
jgi:phospholipase/carboxylesterase